MTPAERAVVEAARCWASSDREAATADLLSAVEALEIERAGRAEGARVEMALTWGELVEGDEVFNRAANKWFPVRAAVRHVGQPMVTVDLVGRKTVVVKPIGDPCQVRRGQTGTAVDTINSVPWSAPSSVARS